MKMISAGEKLYIAKLMLAFLDAEGSQLFLRKTDNVVLGNICTIMRDPVTTREHVSSRVRKLVGNNSN